MIHVFERNTCNNITITKTKRKHICILKRTIRIKLINNLMFSNTSYMVFSFYKKRFYIVVVIAFHIVNVSHFYFVINVLHNYILVLLWVLLFATWNLCDLSASSFWKTSTFSSTLSLFYLLLFDSFHHRRMTRSYLNYYCK